MVWLKACLHCGGDLAEGKDVYGVYIHCLQCARYVAEAQVVALLTPGRLSSPRVEHRSAVTAEHRKLAEVA